MAESRLQFLASPQFAIVIKDADGNSKEYTIHSALLAALSPSLNALVNGNMKEARERCAVWQVDEQTFACFFQFAYAGDYSLKQREPVHPIAVDEALEEQVCTCYSRRSSAAARCGYNKGGTCACRASIDSCRCSIPRRKVRDLMALCMAHREVVLFADYRGIDDLAEAASGKIIKALEDSIDFNPSDVVFELVESSYHLPALKKLNEHMLIYAARNHSRLRRYDELTGTQRSWTLSDGKFFAQLLVKRRELKEHGVWRLEQDQICLELQKRLVKEELIREDFRR
ncbi:hypothetical protein LIA77_11098 [Sarocladium implicatum]|nr:hypothetical protein LIA77_11098 [Sarocladium implicatum]